MQRLLPLVPALALLGLALIALVAGCPTGLFSWSTGPATL